MVIGGYDVGTEVGPESQVRGRKLPDSLTGLCKKQCQRLRTLQNVEL